MAQPEPMRTLLNTIGTLLLLTLSLVACVDALELNLYGTANVLVVDGTITNLAEPQIIRLNRSRSDPFTGRAGTVPISKATVEVIVDSSQVVAAHETTDGSYQLPADFKGQIGHAYQLRFTLADGTRYQSTQQVMPIVAPIGKIRAVFNANSLPTNALQGFTAAHDLYIDTQDPADQTNYYRWDWKLWEQQEWCRTCVQGVYSVNNVIINYSPSGIWYFTAGNTPYEDCFYPPYYPNESPPHYFVYDYKCRTQCWAILSSYTLNVFSDVYINGGMILGRPVAQIPFYQHNPCLVEIRQAALTPPVYQFYKDLQDQTQKTGGITDTPPTASIGNVVDVSDKREAVVGVFTVSAVSALRYWLDRRDTQGVPPGLFLALNGREPSPEPLPPTIALIQILDSSSRSRPYTAICQSSETQTPFKPDGWRD